MSFWDYALIIAKWIEVVGIIAILALMIRHYFWQRDHMQKHHEALRQMEKLDATITVLAKPKLDLREKAKEMGIEIDEAAGREQLDIITGQRMVDE